MYSRRVRTWLLSLLDRGGIKARKWRVSETKTPSETKEENRKRGRRSEVGIGLAYSGNTTFRPALKSPFSVFILPFLDFFLSQFPLFGLALSPRFSSDGRVGLFSLSHKRGIFQRSFLSSQCVK